MKFISLSWIILEKQDSEQMFDVSYLLSQPNSTSTRVGSNTVTVLETTPLGYDRKQNIRLEPEPDPEFQFRLTGTGSDSEDSGSGYTNRNCYAQIPVLAIAKTIWKNNSSIIIEYKYLLEVL